VVENVMCNIKHELWLLGLERRWCYFWKKGKMSVFRKRACGLTCCLAWDGQRRCTVLCFFSCLLLFIFFQFWIYFGLAESRVSNWWTLTQPIQYLLLSTCSPTVIYILLDIFIHYFLKVLQRMFDLDEFQTLYI